MSFSFNFLSLFISVKMFKLHLNRILRSESLVDHCICYNVLWSWKIQYQWLHEIFQADYYNYSVVSWKLHEIQPTKLSSWLKIKIKIDFNFSIHLKRKMSIISQYGTLWLYFYVLCFVFPHMQCSFLKQFFFFKRWVLICLKNWEKISPI